MGRPPWVKTHKLQVGAGDSFPAQQRQKDSEVRRVRNLGGNTRRGKEGAVSLHWPEPHTHHWSLPETHPARRQPGFLWTLELGHTEGQGGGEEAEKTGRTLVGALRLLQGYWGPEQFHQYPWQLVRGLKNLPFHLDSRVWSESTQTMMGTVDLKKVKNL